MIIYVYNTLQGAIVDNYQLIDKQRQRSYMFQGIGCILPNNIKACLKTCQMLVGVCIISNGGGCSLHMATMWHCLVGVKMHNFSIYKPRIWLEMPTSKCGDPYVIWLYPLLQRVNGNGWALLVNLVCIVISLPYSGCVFCVQILSFECVVTCAQSMIFVE